LITSGDSSLSDAKLKLLEASEASDVTEHGVVDATLGRRSRGEVKVAEALFSTETLTDPKELVTSCSSLVVVVVAMP